MEFDIEKITEIYGKGILKELEEQKEEWIENVEYLKEKHAPRIQELMERYPYTFLMDPILFQRKVESLLNTLGINAWEQIEEEMDLWEALDD